MQITLTRCAVRSWRASDADALAKHANNRNIWINLRDAFPHPYSKHDAREFLKSLSQRSPETLFAIAVNDEAVGGIRFGLPPDVPPVVAGIRYSARAAVLG